MSGVSETQAIEVEVVEIDGVIPAARSGPERSDGGGRTVGGGDWQGRIRRLDMRWWPLWVLLSLLVAALALTAGVVVGLLWLGLRIFQRVYRLVFR